MGGVTSGLDALEFIACGATAVAIGAANFLGLDAPRRILGELRDELARRGVAQLADVRGRAWRRAPAPDRRDRARRSASAQKRRKR